MKLPPAPCPILFSRSVAPDTGWGRYTREYCLELFRRRIPFELHLPVAAAPEPDLPFFRRIRRDLPAFYPSLGRRWWRPLSLWIQSQRLRLEGNLLHALVEVPYGYMARWAAHRQRVPYAISIYGTYAVTPFQAPLDRKCYRPVILEADAVFAISRYTRSRLWQCLGQEREVEIRVGGVNLERLALDPRPDPERIHHFLGLPSSCRIILSVGAYKERKGFDLLIQALPIVIKQCPEAYLVLVGSGDPSRYRSQAAQAGLADRVIFLVSLEEARLVELYHACEVFALLPREQEGHFEGLGLVYLEAGACGKPVVGSRSGGVPDAIVDRETGLLVSPENPPAAGAALVELLTDRLLAGKLGANGRRWAAEHSWANCVARHLSSYEKILSRFQRKPRGG